MTLFCILQLGQSKTEYQVIPGVFTSPEKAFEYINKHYVVRDSKLVIAPVSRYIQDNFLTPHKYVVVCDFGNQEIYGIKVLSKLPLVTFIANETLKDKLARTIGCIDIYDIVFVGESTGQEKDFYNPFGVEDLENL